MEIALFFVSLTNLMVTALLAGFVFRSEKVGPTQEKREEREARDKMDEGFENIMNFSVDVHSGAEME